MSLDLIVLGPLFLDELVYLNDTNAPLYPGGAALYAAIGASLLGMKVGLISQVGRDYPEEVIKNLEARGINLEGIRWRQSTSRCVISKNPDGSRSFNYPKPFPAFEKVSPTPDMIPEAYFAAKGFQISPFVYANQAQVIQTIKKHSSGIVSLDPCPSLPKEQRKQFLATAQLTDFFLPSVDEYKLFSQEQSYRLGLPKLSNPSMQAVILKCGEKGIVAFDVKSKRFIEQAPLAVRRVVDTTGAGDTFCGAFTAAWLQHRDLIKAIQIASIAASFTLEAQGPNRLLKTSADEFHDRVKTQLAGMASGATMGTELD